MTDYLLQNIMLYTLVFFRVAGFFAVAPFFGRSNFPVFGKIILALLCAAIITPMVTVPKIGLEWSNLVVLAIKETALGLMLGFVGYILFTSIYLAGQMIDMQMGFGMVNVLDPQNNIQVPIMGNFLYILFFLVFFITNSHHYMIDAFIRSFYIVPAAGGFNFPLPVDMVTGLIAEMFVIAFKISIPIIGSIFLTDVALGIIARTVPQVNVFIVGLPVKIITGLVVMAWVIPVYLIIIDVVFNDVFENMSLLLRAVVR